MRVTTQLPSVTVDPREVRLSHPQIETVRGRHLVVISPTVNLFMTPGEMSELGHRFIELAAHADEREHGPLTVA